MKTIKILSAIVTIFVFSLYFSTNLYSNNISCDGNCTENGCCKEECGSAQGGSENCSGDCKDCEQCCSNGSCAEINSSGNSQNAADNNSQDVKVTDCCK